MNGKKEKRNYRFSPYISENSEFLQKLAKTKSNKKKNALVISANSEQILSILEICANILRSNFTLSLSQRKRLAQHADFYRSLARSRSEKTARKRIQEGSGAAVATLLVPVISALAEHLMHKVLPQQ